MLAGGSPESHRQLKPAAGCASLRYPARRGLPCLRTTHTRTTTITAPSCRRCRVDPDFKGRLLADATEAVNSVAEFDPVAAHLIAVENTPQTHNVVVCTLCSCYPWPVLGLPPVWYKSAPYRSRTVIDPKGVLADFGVSLPAGTDIRIWDSTAETRFLVVPMRPEGTEGWREEALAALVTRDSMVGTGLPKSPAENKAGAAG